MFDLVVIGSATFLALLIVFVGLVVISHKDETQLRKDLDRVTLERDLAKHELAGALTEIGRLTGEISQVRNTLTLSQTDEAAKKTGEPVKARTGAEVRKAVERRNAEELEKHDERTG